VVPAEDVAQFTEALAAMDRELYGEATLGLDPDYFQVHVHMSTGKATIEGIVYVVAGAELRFGQIAADQTYIADALSQFKRLAGAFPVREG
jgi:hypothetical protein